MTSFTRDEAFEVTKEVYAKTPPSESFGWIYAKIKKAAEDGNWETKIGGYPGWDPITELENERISEMGSEYIMSVLRSQGYLVEHKHQYSGYWMIQIIWK